MQSIFANVQKSVKVSITLLNNNYILVFVLLDIIKG